MRQGVSAIPHSGTSSRVKGGGVTVVQSRDRRECRYYSQAILPFIIFASHPACSPL